MVREGIVIYRGYDCYFIDKNYVFEKSVILKHSNDSTYDPNEAHMKCEIMYDCKTCKNKKYLVSLCSIPFTVTDGDGEKKTEYIYDIMYEDIYVKEITKLDINKIYINSREIGVYNESVLKYEKKNKIDENMISEDERNANFIICDGEELLVKKTKIKKLIELRKSNMTMEQGY